MQRSPLENGPKALPNRLQRLSASPGGLSDLMGERTGQNGENLKNKNSDRLALKKTTQSNKSRVSSAQGDEFQSQNSFDNGNNIGPSSGQILKFGKNYFGWEYSTPKYFSGCNAGRFRNDGKQN